MTSALRDAIDSGSSLPSSWYTDPAIFRGETERILRRSWHFVTDTTKLAAVGDQFALGDRRRADLARARSRRPDPRLRQHLPSSWLPRRHRAGEPLDPPVRLPRLELRPRRLAAPRATGRARALVRHRGDLPAAGASRGVGTDGVGQRRRHRAVVRGLDVGSARADGRAGLRPRGLRARVREHVGDRVQLEGVPGQHDRVLPLPDDASGVLARS